MSSVSWIQKLIEYTGVYIFVYRNVLDEYFAKLFHG